MQQTKTYKLNLIEMSDTFSPAPLNENMEKVEAELSAETAARQSGDAALDQRVTVLEGHKMTWGSYKGSNDGDMSAMQTISLDFTPGMVYVRAIGLSATAIMILDNVPFSAAMKIIPNGFTVSGNFNGSSSTYVYFAVC